MGFRRITLFAAALALPFLATDAQASGRPTWLWRHGINTVEIARVAVSPDGRWYATAGGDEMVRLWRSSDGSLLRLLEGHLARVTAVAFSRDSRWLASVGEDGTVRLWSADDGFRNGEPIAAERSAVTAVAFSPESNQLVWGTENGGVTSWDVDASAPIFDVSPHTGPITCLDISPGGRLVACGSEDRRVSLLRAADGSLAHRFFGHTQPVRGVDFSEDGRLVASCGDEGLVKIWHAHDHTLVATLAGHTGAVTCVAFSPQVRNLLVSGSEDHSLRVWDTAEESQVRNPIYVHGGAAVRSVAFLPGGWEFLSGDSHGGLVIAQARNRVRQTVAEGGAAFECLAVTPDRQMAIAGDAAGGTHFIDVKTGRRQDNPGVSIRHAGPVRGVACSPDGRLAATAGADHRLRLWQAYDGQHVREIMAHAGEAMCVAFSPSGGILASGGSEGAIKLWRSSDGAAIGDPLAEHVGAVTCLAFSPDGSLLASGSDDRRIVVWQVRTGHAVRVLEGHSTRVSVLCFTPDGGRLASASVNGDIRVWDVTSGSEVAAVPGERRQAVRGLRFSSEGGLLFEGNADGFVRVRETGGWTEIMRYGPHLGDIRGLEFCPGTEIRLVFITPHVVGLTGVPELETVESDQGSDPRGGKAPGQILGARSAGGAEQAGGAGADGLGAGSWSGARVTSLPSEGAAEIAFAVPGVQQPVHLAIYDVHGRRVAALLDEVRSAGEHVVRWDGATDRGAPAAPGVYYANLVVGDRVYNRALAIVR